MSAAAPLWPAWLRDELVPRPGRWRDALVMCIAATLALAVALTLQIASFPAPLIAYKALLPNIVCTWRNLLARLAVITVAAVVVLPTVGVLVQVPWLLLPVFFVVISVLTYFAPLEQSPIRGYCMALTVGAMSYTAIFAPAELGWAAVTLAGGFSIGLVVATAMAQRRGADHPHDRLSRVLADVFTTARTRVQEAGTRYCAATPDVDAPPIAAPPDGALPRLLQLLDLVRQEGRRPELVRAFVALITAVERIQMYVALAESLARQPTPRAYRRLVDAELTGLLAAIEFGLTRYADAARRPDSVLSFEAAPPTGAGGWPDFHARVAALRVRQRALVDAGHMASIGIEEAENVNAFTQVLAGIADVLEVPPEALEHVAPEPRAAQLPAFDPYAAQFAMKIGFGATLALVVGVVSHVQDLQVIILSPLLLAQGSYGATIRRAGLRMTGVVTGGLLAALVVVAVMPNTGEVAVWLLVFFAVLLPTAYIALGTPRFAYFGMQVALTFMIVMVDPQPTVDIHHVLWRFFGTMLGSGIVLGVFQVVLPDYAGRQIVSRFGDLLRTLLPVVPELDRSLPPVAETQRASDAILTGIAAVLRLAEEARWESHDGGVDRLAAIDAAGLLRRVAHRWALIRRSRRLPRPPLPPAVHDAIAGLEAALRLHLRALLEMVEARHHRARPGSRVHRSARAAARTIAARPRPNLDAPLHVLEEAVAAARRDTLHQWPIEAASALLAEIGHFHRLVELTPALGASLERMSLPPELEPLPVAITRQRPSPVSVSANGGG